ncbi:uncharacterized protein FIESC28_00659 [Fusarium coffeatum]|uniref:Uncharacterized protein n=1 Tax=Fusarium coffeatum TaxID=231269 RepID=A0A366SC54_9HYPO|nr:uncharacterized protein FIESC28_00659 [Fusarium coffeatum]RBR26542.1 hypothetical protein FIESC28_00659 [Fusarium coffeatum]
MSTTFRVSRTQGGQDRPPRPAKDLELRTCVPVKALYPDLAMEDLRDANAAAHTPMQQPPYVDPQTGQRSSDVYSPPVLGLSQSSHQPSRMLTLCQQSLLASPRLLRGN